MFTGIVEAVVPALSLHSAGSGARLLLPAPALPDWRVGRGQSLSISGACLTVADLVEGGESRPDGTPGAAMAFDLSAETLECTWLGELRPGRAVNLERAMIFGERLDGHLVSGHVDGRGRVSAIRDSGDGGQVIAFEVSPEHGRYLVDKGSVTLDGISLTVVGPSATASGGRRFEVAVIPHTLALTSLGTAAVGDAVNVEVDLVGRWVERLLGERGRSEFRPGNG
jgi:riboflavin synthase